MQGVALSVKRLHIIRIDPGEDVLLSVRRYVKDARVSQAVVVSAYGTLARHHLHWVAHNRLPAENNFGRGEGGIEILSINGLVVEGEPHLHVSLATPGGAYGGHLEEGCIVYVLCEVFLLEVDGVNLHRERVEVDVPGMGHGHVLRLLFGS